MKNINKYLKSGIVLGALVYSVGTTIPMQSTYADEINTETVVKEWRPEGKVIAQGEDGVPWELYENGYLLFKPVPGKDTLTSIDKSETAESPSWKRAEVKAIGFTDKVYLPEDSSYLFANSPAPGVGANIAEFLDASKIDTSKVKNMYNMFLDSRFPKLDLNTWDTSNVENMRSMFFNSEIKELKIDKWNTSKVKDMKYFLYQARDLKELNIQDWDTSNVEDMSEMFHETTKLKELDIVNWNTSKVKNMAYMFAVSDLEKLDLSKWDTSNVEDMQNTFASNPKLRYLDITNFDTGKVNNLERIFTDTGLTTLKIGDKFAKTQLKDGLFGTLDFEYIGELMTLGQKYGNKWTRLDRKTEFYSVEEWDKEYRANPEKLAGMWVREKNYNGYDIVFETGTDEIIEPLEVEIGKDFELPVPTKVKEGYHFVGWSKTQDGEIIKDKTNLGKKNETVTLYAKWEKNPPVSTNTPIDENNNPILPPTVNELPEYNGGANPSDAPVNEKPEYTGPLSTNTPVDDKGELVLPPVVNDLPEFNGGVNPTDSFVNEKPEYNGGVNSIEPPINEKPEYKDSLSTNTPVNDKGELVLPPTVNDLPEYKTATNDSTVNNTEKSETPKEETKKERELPNTNSGSILASLVSSVIGTLGLGYKSKRRK